MKDSSSSSSSFLKYEFDFTDAKNSEDMKTQASTVTGYRPQTVMAASGPLLAKKKVKCSHLLLFYKSFLTFHVQTCHIRNNETCTQQRDREQSVMV